VESGKGGNAAPLPGTGQGKVVEEKEEVRKPDAAAEQADKALQSNLSSMLFVEMLFWKNAHDAEAVRDYYDFKVHSCCSLIEHFL